MRSFIALEIAPAFSAELLAISQRLQSVLKGRFVPQANYHLTLAFLGEIDESELLEAICALQIASTACGPVMLKPSMLTSFGSKKKATLVLALDGEARPTIPSQSSSLNELAQRLRASLTQASLTFDEKRFYPHITLARKVALEDAPDNVLSIQLPKACLATKITLFQSHLLSTGARYEPRFSLTLNTQ